MYCEKLDGWEKIVLYHRREKTFNWNCYIFTLSRQTGVLWTILAIAVLTNLLIYILRLINGDLCINLRPVEWILHCKKCSQRLQCGKIKHHIWSCSMDEQSATYNNGCNCLPILHYAMLLKINPEFLSQSSLSRGLERLWRWLVPINELHVD